MKILNEVLTEKADAQAFLIQALKAMVQEDNT